MNFREYSNKINEINEDENRFEELDPQLEVTREELYDLIDYLDEIDYDTIADLILDFIDSNYEDEKYEDEIEEDEEDEEIDEKVATIFKGKKKGVRKFALSKAKIRQNKKKNKAKLRKDRVKNRIKRKKNKIKIKKYQASYSKAIKKGQHQAKVHRGK